MTTGAPPVELMLVGCGLMGGRHLRGYAELERARPGSLRLRAVCDPRQEAAERVADEAEALLGRRPATYPGAGEALAAETGLEAADVVTNNRTHADLAVRLLEAGLHVQLEKPLEVTVRRGRRIVDAAARCGRVLGVAENNRRDPMNRLLRHAVRAGLVGTPNFLIQNSTISAQRVIVSPWRHDPACGGLALDVGIHLAYMIEYFMGPVETVYAVSRQVAPVREWPLPDGSVERVPVASDDVYSICLSFESGAHGSWVMHYATAGGGTWQRLLFGDQGTAVGPPDRSGRAVRLDRGGESVEGEALVGILPDFRLSDMETRLFGERPAGYRLSSQETDRKLIAAETGDFLEAVREGRPPEVPADLGLRSVALVMAVLESAAAGRPVRMADVLTDDERAVQQEIEAAGD